MSPNLATDLFSMVSARLAGAGHRARAVGVKRIGELAEEIAARRERGEVDPTFYRDRLSGFAARGAGEFSRPLDGALRTPPPSRSVIVVATAQPTLRVTFERDGSRHAAIIPPTYCDGSDRRVRDLLLAALRPHGYRVERTGVPVKLLAVRSGLAEYGRNNITYIEGLGSFFRLTAFVTDAPLVETEWIRPRLAAPCEHCSACRARCPTGAIGSDRVLLRAEKCLTFHNESDAPFPEWIDPAWHHCLIGCMRCQVVCPMNRECIHWTEDSEAFTAEETAQILQEEGTGKLGRPAREKLRRVGLLDDVRQLGRNLRAVIDRR
jgi:epoxyqueuosine reductase